MQYEKAYSFLMPKLEADLPAWLTYHSAAHTQYVINAAEILGKAEHVGHDEMILLKTAALFHDAGFLQQSDGHEEVSCILAREYLPEFSYTDEQVEDICRMIMATRLPQTPVDHLGELLCDADLYYLGKEGYGNSAERLYREFKHTGFVKTDTEWQLKQIEFLSGHKYFTKTAKEELEVQKQKVLKTLNTRL